MKEETLHELVAAVVGSDEDARKAIAKTEPLFFQFEALARLFGGRFPSGLDDQQLAIKMTISLAEQMLELWGWAKERSKENYHDGRSKSN